MTVRSPSSAAVVLFAFVGFGDSGEGQSGLSFVEAFESVGESDLATALAALAAMVICSGFPELSDEFRGTR